MKNKIFIIFLTSMLLIHVLASAQLSYDFHLNFGYSNLREINKETSVEVSNYYTKLPLYAIGSNLYIPIKNSKFQFISGIDFLSLAAENHMPDGYIIPGYTGPRYWVERFYSLSVPLNINYKFEKWIFLKGGFSNTVHLNEPENMYDKKINHFTLGISGGLTFLIKKRFTAGINYFHELVPTAKLLKLPSSTKTYKISFPFEQYNFEIGVLLNK